MNLARSELCESETSLRLSGDSRPLWGARVGEWSAWCSSRSISSMSAVLACQNDHGSSTSGFAATKTCLLAARSPSAISSSTCLGFECSSQATVRIFLVDEWATGRSGEAGGVGATGLGSGWATSGVQCVYCSESHGARIGVTVSAQEGLGTLHPAPAALITSVGLVRPTHGLASSGLAPAAPTGPLFTSRCSPPAFSGSASGIRLRSRSLLTSCCRSACLRSTAATGGSGWVAPTSSATATAAAAWARATTTSLVAEHAGLVLGLACTKVVRSACGFARPLRTELGLGREAVRRML
mmetsp:Transcript_28079/g.71317  ORF Transcript_28079/g.71317 Transcript_28079/m.71317 type:complete len:297 (-) Transcript_28079:76-966(-)